ncbi:MAG: hypothetical protein HRT58_00545 [Crocinitomicaceae bacterium]|nr:hypothetical protein [Flavobacteriales bacterium]NQZ34110.1 hypothetical protein [Crocinitomicaceae bacterium]
MKKVVILIAMGLFTIGSSFAGSDPVLIEEISQKVTIDLSTITLDKYEKDFVLVQFKIYDGLIQIVKIEASQPELKYLIISELEEIHIKTPYSESEIHNFNFTFKKK